MSSSAGQWPALDDALATAEDGSRHQQQPQQMTSGMHGMDKAVEGHNERGVATPFVGRDGELRLLSAALDSALSGAGQVVLLAGEPGIGKTRTAQQLERLSRARGALVLWGNCHEWEGAPAYWPWTQALRGWLRDMPADERAALLGAQAAQLAQIVPELHEWLPDLTPLAPNTTDAPDTRFARLLSATATAIRAAAVRGTESAPRGLVIVLDDIHWAGAPSLQLLRYLAQDIRDAPVLLVATYRDAEIQRQQPVATVLADLTREPHCRRVLLRGLQKPHLARFVALASGRAQPPALIDALYAGTGGNPFFVTEVVHLMADEGQFDDEHIAFQPSHVPASVRGAIGRRLGRLSVDCNAALRVASVIGREFEVRLLERATGTPALDLFSMLDEATSAQLLNAAESPGVFRFSHALVQEALYSDLTAVRTGTVAPRCRAGTGRRSSPPPAMGGIGAPLLQRHATQRARTSPALRDRSRLRRTGGV